MKEISFRYNENEWKIIVYDFEWEWHPDYMPVDPSDRMERHAEELAIDNGMIRL